MINLNSLILKIIYFNKLYKSLKISENSKKGFNYFSKKTNPNLFLNKKLKFSALLYNFNLFNSWLVYCNLFFYFFSKIFIKEVKKNSEFINFNKTYLNIFYKKNYMLISSLYNFYVKNNFFFYKEFNNSYVKKILKRFKKRRLNFFILDKSKVNKNFNFYRNNFFINFKDYFKTTSFLKKKKLKPGLEYLDIYNNLIFNLKATKINFNISYLNIVQESSDFISFFFNYYISFFKKKIKPKKKKKTIYSNFYRISPKKSVFIKFNFVSSDLFSVIAYQSALKYSRFIKPVKTPNPLNNFKWCFLRFERLTFFITTNTLALIFNFSSKNSKILYIKNIKNFKINKKILFNKRIFGALKNLVYLNDLFVNNTFFNKGIHAVMSSTLFLKNLVVTGDSFINKSIVKKSNNNNIKYNLNCYNNFYPIYYANSISRKKWKKKVILNAEVNYFNYVHFYVLAFLEKYFKRKFFLKTVSNKLYKPKHRGLLREIYSENRNFQLKFQPKYMKRYYLIDFLEIMWYSLYFKDLTLLAQWISRFLENTHFRYHRKFVLFFHNFMKKYHQKFFGLFNIYGFFFDIRGKVGVSGNSKKRHLFFRMGSLNRSKKDRRMDYNHSIVRTPSGALGLTFIINF